MDFNLLDVTAFVAFLVFVIGISLWVSRKEENQEDYFLAGRGLSWWMIGLSLIASNISTEHFVGMAGQGFQSDIGMAIASYEWIAALSLIIVAIFLLPLFLRLGIYTIPEFLEHRYNRAARTFMALCMLVFYVGVTMATVLYAGALGLFTIFEIPIRQGVWYIGITAGVYTIYGGLKAVVWSDVIQGTALLIGGIVVTFIGLDAVGGLDRFIELSEGRLHTVLPADHPELPWTAVFIGGMWIPNLYYWGLNQFIMQRTLGAKDITQGQRGVLFGATLKLIIPIIVVFPGIMAFELYGDQIVNGDAAYPTLIKNLLPSGLVGFMLAALFGATMSTLDSLLNSAATIFTIDIYKPYFNPEADPKLQVKVGRICTFILVIIACFWAPIVSGFEGGLYRFIQLYWGFLQPGVVAVFFLGIAWDKVPKRAALWAMMINIPIYGLLLYLYPDIAFLHHMFITFGIILLFLFLFTWLLPDAPGEKLEKKRIDYTLTPEIKWWSIGVFLATIALYIVFW